MPRFSKPVVENDHGEMIMPGAYQAAPGGICERRSTFEWDNNDRALINVDELSVDLSDDSDCDDDCNSHCHAANDSHCNANDSTTNCNESHQGTSATTASRTTTTASLGTATTHSQQFLEQLGYGDEEQGLSQSQLSEPQQQEQEGEEQQQQQQQPSQQPVQQPAPQDALVEAYMVHTSAGAGDSAAAPDASSKSPKSFLGYARGAWIKAFVFALLTAGLVTIVFWKRKGPFHATDKNSDATHATTTHEGAYGPPSPALAYRQELGLQQVVADILVDDSNDDKLRPDWESPYFQALYWLMYEDPLQLTLLEEQDPSNKNATVPVTVAIQQRYTMAAFYFATSMPSDIDNSEAQQQQQQQRPSQSNAWKQCAAPSRPGVPTQQQMQCTHQELTSWSPTREYTHHPDAWRWLSSAHECDWAGVECNNQGLVVMIDLADYGLRGILIPELAFGLTFLQTLSLPYNGHLTGRIPSSLLRVVERLELQYNQHNGTLLLGNDDNDDMEMEEDIAMPLHILNLANNNLMGSLSTELGRLNNLRQLFLEGNELTGSLEPVIFSQWSNLERLRLGQNEFEGLIPTTMFTSPLRELDLSRNAAMTGSIPSEIGTLGGSLRTLGLAEMQLEGTLPLELYELTKLAVLDLHNNAFVGTMATNVGQLRKLQKLYWQDNRFEGQLPTQLGSLANMVDFRINGTDFEGTIPTEFCEMGNEAELDLPLAYSVYVSADCTPEGDHDDGMTNALQCPKGCCSTCCQKSTGECTLDPSGILGIKSLAQLEGNP